MTYTVCGEGFNEGYDAYMCGRKERDNPFDPDNHKETDQHCQWRAGWYAAWEDARDSVIPTPGGTNE